MTALAPEAPARLRVGVVTRSQPDPHDHHTIEAIRRVASTQLMGMAPWSPEIGPTVEAWGPLDVLVWLAPQEPPSALSTDRTLWRIDYGGDSADSPGFADWIQGDPVRLRLIARHNGRDEVLREGWIPSEPYRYGAQRETLRAIGARWTERVLREAATGTLKSAPLAAPLQPRRQRLDPLSVVRVGARLGRRLAESFTHRPSWRIGIVHRPIEAFAAGRALDDSEIRWLKHTVPHGYLADPIGAVKDGRAYLFAEVLRYDRRQGHLVVLEEDGHTFGSPEPLELDGPGTDLHTSFPGVFEALGTWWCVPERQAAREVALYRSAGFPRRWKREATLIQGVAACDPVVFFHEDRWWLFATDDEAPGGALLAWWSHALTGPYQPHALNPLVEGLGAARQAGPLFSAQGTLHRPAQDSRAGYGSAIAIYEILRLDPCTYRERLSGRVTPDPWGTCPVGVHTLSPLGREATLIDGKRWILMDPDHLRQQAIYKLLRR